jgi:hypothetical protein
MPQGLLPVFSRFFRWHVLTIPGATAPIVGRQLVAFALNATRPSAIALLASWLALLNGHIGIAKTHHFLFPILTGFDDKLLTALNLSFRAITGQISRVLGHWYRYRLKMALFGLIDALFLVKFIKVLRLLHKPTDRKDTNRNRPNQRSHLQKVSSQLKDCKC